MNTPDIFFDPLPSSFERIGVKITGGYAMIKDGLLPRPVHIGRSSRLPRHEVIAVAAARMSGATDDEIRALVTELMNNRESIAKYWRTAATAAAT